MRILLVLDHPYTMTSADNIPHQRSFTAAVAAAAQRGAKNAGHEVDLIDLSADGFSPAMTAILTLPATIRLRASNSRSLRSVF